MKKIQTGLILLIVLGFISTLVGGVGDVYGQADWYNSNWQYRKPISLTGAGLAGTHYQIKIVVSFVFGHMEPDFSDIIFTDDDGTTPLPHWRESYTESSTATFWVKVTDNLSSPNTPDIYVYYGNSGATSALDGENTFEFFDDFSGDLSKWAKHVGTTNIYTESGHLKLNGTGHQVLGSDATYSGFADGIIEFKYYLGDGNAIAEIGFRGNYTANTGYKGRYDARTNEGDSFLKPPYGSWNFWTGSHNTGYATPNGQWRTGRIMISGSTVFKIWDNGALFTSTGDSSYSSAGEISLQQHNGAYALYDDVRVRKYSSPEPSVGSTGAEETESATYTPEKTMVDYSTSTGSGGGVVSAQDVTQPTDPLAISARSWVVTSYGNDSFPTYSALQTMYDYTNATTITDLSGITADGVYKVVDDLEIASGDGPPCGPGFSAVIFVGKDLIIGRSFTDATVSGDPLTAKNDCSSSLAFIVSNEIDITSDAVNNVYGIFYTSGDIKTGSSGNPLYVFGSLIADEFQLDRNLGADNSTSPAEQIIFMPQYLLTLKNLLGRSQVGWKEVR